MSDCTINANMVDSECGLFKLPPELRNKIYDYVVVMGIIGRQGKIKEPGITLTNRQLRSECLPMFYGANKFAFTCFGHAGNFLEKLDDKRRSMLKLVAIDGVHDDEKAWMRIAEKALRWLNKRYGGKGMGDNVILAEIAANPNFMRPEAPTVHFVSVRGIRRYHFLYDDAEYPVLKEGGQGEGLVVFRPLNAQKPVCLF
ncbi:hypothetical protein PRZ48_013987 [Zasmidium cellare]|uniref:Uncharacterized protein n=1 Tax=Zasmidium cellare TaxID=395010 RepID=A0ABR0E057_ZASCE|nr:hypothetical protein PRZ48_013987 [Zasmidium cellare]